MMNSVCYDDNKEDKSGEGSSSVEVDDDILGDWEKVPRIGDEYQAKIPSLVEAIYLPKPELPSPLVQAQCVTENSCGMLESFISEEGQVISYENALLVGEGKNVEKVSNFQSSSKCNETCIIVSYPEMKTEMDQSGGKDLLVHGFSVDQSWTDFEYNRFLLCLYVFGKKNFKFVKKFVGGKNMGDIMSFYYGKFYRSKGYRRWSVSRKLRSKRYICGKKMFTEWRQQELLSRLFPHVSGECQTMLVEISRNFAEDRMAFVEYIFALKDAVGIDLLVDAVGIGKGKQDLTSTAVEQTRTGDIFSLRPKIPITKARSSLTPPDIIKFLNGNFRLSKSRSSDLFWEAVWPRLLAKGWHSEQPTAYTSFGTKQSLVFLVPGVEKFSRALVNGNHYFDSVSDILTKVASDPGLIETEIQATDGSVDRENILDKPYLDGVSNKQHHFFLQPHSSKCDQDLMKFTIVDTSMVQDMNQNEVRKLRSLPSETVSVSTISSCSNESEKNTSEDSKYQVEQANASCPIEDRVEVANPSYPIQDQVEHASAAYLIEEVFDKGVSIDSSHCTPIPETFNIAEVEVQNHKLHSDMHIDKHSREINDHRSIQNMISDCSNSLSCMEMQKLRACKHVEFSRCTESTSMKRNFDLNKPTSESDQNDAYAEEISGENSETRMLIDLNFPQVPQELGTNVDIPSFMVIMQNDNQCENTSSFTSEVTQLNRMQEFPYGHEEQQPIIANRRQSTRNRPLTTKALEAIEYGFLNSKRKRKKSAESSDSNLNSRTSHACNRTFVSAACDKGIGIAMAGTREEGNVIQEYRFSIDLNREAHYNF
ncbi:putative transcription factor MYB/SANT family [Lupinus albus]|uniref:Putative transcription factor MYB/SANT family n=1 Tax=Lupinus albus TaxID=3870 RepID=A0A6A4P659_LUPAL|nr:putative transcription factor MYB/SANT family [Lupinus albus]